MTHIRIVRLAILLAFSLPLLRSQPQDRDGSFFSERQLFTADVLSYPSDSAGVSRVDLYLEIPYDGLQFVKAGEFFRSTFEISVGIYDPGNTLITEKLWRENLDIASIDEIRTLKPGEIVQKNVLLAPGAYYFNIQVRDRETGRSSTSRLEVTVADYSMTPWALSDAMLIKSFEVIDGKRVITPNIPGAIPDASDSFFVYLKLMNGLDVYSAVLILDVVDRSAAVVRSDTAILGVGKGENTLIPSVNSKALPVGEYTLRVLARPAADSSGRSGADTVSAKTEREFRIRWVDSPIAVEDLDRAIDQMQYILDKDRLEEMKEVVGPEKRSGWLDYWKKKDPTPGTERNELMEEYYGRVAYANKHFGHYAEGWKTDMGMIYIVFGMPSNIERHPFEMESKPYEVWTYYEQNRQFVFVDATGFGDYRLQTPIWDVYQTRPR